MPALTINWIQAQVASGSYEFSEHADFERGADKLTIADIEAAILDGEILEQYPDDPRGASCLVLGHAPDRRPVHIVCGKTPLDSLRIITVYVPTLPKWLDERTRRATRRAKV
ncbi:MAG: DUF4258 domain-containing protein [Verrucomicrobia bacterium]|nr:DUF4258 domain-containing protein [Verrucomicrobiota bacterium]